MKHAVLLIGILWISGCNVSSGPHRPVPLAPTAGSSAQGVSVVGFDQVRPLLARFCSECHPARSGPDWLDYNQALAYAQNGKLKARVVVQRNMPAVGSPQAASISDADRRMIGAWADAGGPRESVSASAVPLNAPGGGSPAADETSRPLIQKCLQCHGIRGPGSDNQVRVPRIGGQNQQYLFEQLRRFAWRERVDPEGTMNDVASILTPEDMREAALFFSRWQGLVPDRPQHVPERDRQLAVQGEMIARRACNSCHRNGAAHFDPTDGWIPVLEGQSRIYLRNQLIEFRKSSERSATMHEIAKRLSNQDIEAVAIYFDLVR